MKQLLISVVAVAVTLLLGIGANATPSASAASFVVSNLNDAGAGSLRAAIDLANETPGPDAITFIVSGVINLTSSLNLNDPGTTIDGSGQNIVIDGSAMSPSPGVFVVNTTSATFKKLTIQNTRENGVLVNFGCGVPVEFLTVANVTMQGIARSGVSICAPNVKNVSITGSTIQAAQGDFGNGVEITRFMPGGVASDLAITSLSIARSTISGQNGVQLMTSGAANAFTVSGVSIMDSTLTGTQFNAVSISTRNDDAARLTVKDVTIRASTLTAPMAINIGASAATTVNDHITILGNKITSAQYGAINIIGGNNRAIVIDANDSITGLASNAIGISGNTNTDISISRNATIKGAGKGPAIGIGALTSTRNVLVNNNGTIAGDDSGIGFYYASKSGGVPTNTNENISISGNGTITRKNYDGIFVEGAKNNGINVSNNASVDSARISANENTNIAVTGNQTIASGVQVASLKGSTTNTNKKILVANNKSMKTVEIGDAKSANSIDSEIAILNNTITGGKCGIFVVGANSGRLNGSIIGNTAYGNIAGICLKADGFTVTRNVIHDNSMIGINVMSGTNNLIAANSLYGNTKLGIDLGGDGVTPNDSGDADTGPNNLQNYPELTLVKVVGNTTQIAGALNSAPNALFTIQFFSNPACHPSGYGEGKTLIGTTMVKTDANGNAKISITLPGQAPTVSATATDMANNTSEFSKCVVATSGN